MGGLARLGVSHQRIALVLACFGLASSGLHAQVTLATEPASPLRGALVRLRVTPTIPDLLSGLVGSLADEPLHFRSSDGVTWTSLAGIPISGGDSVPVTLVLIHGGRRDTVHTAFQAAQGNYPVDQLTVAPRMAEPGEAARRRIARENARARVASRASHDLAPLWEEPFILPRESRITSGFGNGREYNGKVISRHLGTDFEGAVGDPVRAVNRGRVALVADFYLAGKVIYLDHGDGIVSAYFHLSKALVRSGQMVSRGQVIGAVGRSGRVTGPHLHFVMRYGGTTVDPMSVMSLLGGDTAATR